MKPQPITRAFIERSARRSGKAAAAEMRKFLWLHKRSKFMGICIFGARWVEARCTKNGKCPCHKRLYHLPPYCCHECRSMLVLRKLTPNERKRQRIEDDIK